jgi:hypothetical protein
MSFCLADGARLLEGSVKADPSATWRMYPAAVEPEPVQPKPTVAAQQPDQSRPVSTIQYRPGLMDTPQPPSVVTSVREKRSVLPWLFAIVLALGGSGVLIAWIVTRDRTEKAQASQVPAATPEPTTQATPQNTQPSGQLPGVTRKPVAAKPDLAKDAPVRKQVVTAETAVHRPVITSPDKKKEQGTAKREKTPVSPPASTGESFIPVSPKKP